MGHGVLLALFLWVVFVFPPPECASGETVKNIRVLRVNDGDTVTVKLGRKKEHVRLIGIDAPELGQGVWGRRALAHLSELILKSNSLVIVEYDVEKRDKYERLLAYLYLRDGQMVNQLMLTNGYAVLLTIPPNIRHVERLREAQDEARRNRRGIWGRGGIRERPADYRKKHQVVK